MDELEPLTCDLIKLPSEGGTYILEKLEPTQCCSVKIPFYALNPGKYTIQVKFTYKEGNLELLKVNTVVESKIEITLNIGVVMFAHVLTRLNLNFTLEPSNLL